MSFDFSENDFPTLKSSGARCKTWKWNKTLSSQVISQNIDPAESNQQPCNSESVLNYAQKKINDLYRGQLNESTKRPYMTFSLDIEDLISKPEKPRPKNRGRVIKHFSGNTVLSGNPLDSDNPVRQRGFMNLYKKPKHLSKTKAAVLESRKELKICKDFATKVSIQNDSVLAKSEVPMNYLWKSVYYGKNHDLKNLIRERSKSHEKFSVSDSDFGEVNKNEASVSTTSSDVDSYCVSVQELLQNSPIPPHKMFVHHHNFKTYCDNCVTQELNEAASALISKVVKYQFNKYDVNPVKAVAHRRYVVGLKQVKKYITLNKIKLFIIVPDMEDSLSETVEELKSLAAAYCIPYFFALSRRKAGFLSNLKNGITCFGILNYSGAEKNFDRTLAAMKKAKRSYQMKCSQAEKFYESCVASSLKDDSNVKENLDEIIHNMETNFSFRNEIPETEMDIPKPVHVGDGKTE